jgi:hypothetical protein
MEMQDVEVFLESKQAPDRISILGNRVEDHFILPDGFH